MIIYVDISIYIRSMDIPFPMFGTSLLVGGEFVFMAALMEIWRKVVFVVTVVGNPSYLIIRMDGI